MYQALYRKYRPKNFDEVVGQEIVVKTLKNAITKNKISHAYLFTGPRGCGKTTIAKIFAKLVNCKNPANGINCGNCVCCTLSDDQNMDIIEMDAASNNGVDEIREINNKVKLAPTLGKYKIYIIDEVHMLTIGAFNALLKTLEEPPQHVIFILATTDPHKVPITILSRCQRFDLKKISTEKIYQRLKYICEQEKIEIEDQALKEISRLGDGCLRDSIGLLDQVISYSDNKVTLNDIYEVNGTISQEDVYYLIKDTLNNNIKSVIEKISFYNNNGKSIIKITEEIITFIRNTILSKTIDDYQEKIYSDIMEQTNIEFLLMFIKIMNETLLDMKKFSNTKMLLEMSFIKIITNNQEESKNELIENNIKINKVDKIEIKNKDDKLKFINKKEIIKTKEEQIEIEKIKYDKNENLEKQDLLNKINEIIEIRVNNTLSNFDKKTTIEERNRLKQLNNYVMDEKYNNYVTMLLDGELKAVGGTYAIFVYKTNNLANLFNENIDKLEETVKELLKQDYKLVSVDSEKWDVLKKEFNNKTKKFEYKEEKENIKEILKELNNTDDDMQSLFGNIVEYN